MCKKSMRLWSLVSCVLSLLLLLCSSFCFCFADDWSQGAYNVANGRWSLTVRYSGGYDTVFFPSSEDGKMITIAPSSTYSSVDRFTFSWYPDSPSALGLDGVIDFMMVTGHSLEPSSVSCIAYFGDGTSRSVPISRFGSSGVSLDAVVFDQAPVEIGFYFAFSTAFDWGASTSPAGAVGVQPSTNFLLGSGSNLSPTFPGSGVSASDIPRDAVSNFVATESQLEGSIASGLGAATDKISGVPDILNQFTDSLNFWRVFFDDFLGDVSFLSLLLDVSLALGVVALLLNLAPWASRHFKK